MQQQPVPVLRVIHRPERQSIFGVSGVELSLSIHAASSLGLWVLLCVFWGLILTVALTSAL